jgi:hypothetical protein
LTGDVRVLSVVTLRQRPIPFLDIPNVRLLRPSRHFFPYSLVSIRTQLLTVLLIVVMKRK